MRVEVFTNGSGLEIVPETNSDDSLLHFWSKIGNSLVNVQRGEAGVRGKIIVSFIENAIERGKNERENT